MSFDDENSGSWDDGLYEDVPFDEILEAMGTDEEEEELTEHELQEMFSDPNRMQAFFAVLGAEAREAEIVRQMKETRARDQVIAELFADDGTGIV